MHDTIAGRIPNLWPDNLGAQIPVTPKAILTRQALVITEKTKNRVKGEIRTKVLGRDFVHTFYLVTPGLDNYSHFVTRIRHSIEASYPLKVYSSESDDTGRELESERAFYEHLAAVIRDERTLSVVRSLVAQSD